MSDKDWYIEEAEGWCRKIYKRDKPKDAKSLAKTLFDEMEDDRQCHGQVSKEECLQIATKCFSSHSKPKMAKSIKPKKKLPQKPQINRSKSDIEFDGESKKWHKTFGEILAKSAAYYSFGSEGDIAVKVGNRTGAILDSDVDEFLANTPEHALFYKDKKPYRLSRQDGRECLKSIRFLKALPELHRVIKRPLPRRTDDGNLVAPTAGYNEATKEYYHPMPDAKKGFVEMELEKAVSVVSESIKEICFETDDDKARYLCTMFDPFFDGFYSGVSVRGKVPLIACLGNQSGIGKDATRKLINHVFGWDFQEQPAEPDTTEFFKVFGAAVEGGISNYHIGEPGNGNECQKITNLLRSIIVSNVMPRKLGKSHKIQVPDGMRFSLSAKKDAVFDSDMPRRTFPIRLFYEDDAKDINWERCDWDRWLEQHQWELYCALHTIVVEWYNAGMPQNASRWSGNFHTWSRFVGGIVLWAFGLDAFSTPPHSILSSTAEVADNTADVIELYSAIREAFLTEDTIIKGSDITRIAKDIEGDPFCLNRDKPHSKKFAGIIKNSVGRVYDGIKLILVTDENTSKNIRFGRMQYKILLDE